MCHPPRAGLRARQIAHQVGPAADSTARHAAGQDLAEHGEVRMHPGDLLDTAWCPAEARDHLVVHEQRSRPVRKAPRRGEKPVRKRYRAPGRSRRFQDHGGDVAVAELAGEHVRVRGNDGSRPGDRSGKPRCVGPVEGRIRAHGHLVVPAVEMPGQFHDPVPAGGRPGQTERQQRRLSPARGEAHPLRGRDKPDHKFGPRALQFMTGARMERPAGLGRYGRDHLGMAVPKQQ